MKKLNANSFRIGLKIIINKIPYSIIENEFNKPGKGQSFNRVKMRNLISHKIIEKTLRPSEFFETADITELDMQYLYKGKDSWFFINNANYEQYEVSKNIIGNNKIWLKEKNNYIVTLWNDRVILVTPPNFVTLEVTDTSHDTKNDSLSGNKLATLETGAVIKVPFFIKNNELVKINTKLSQYVSRINRS
jgi:elongation factor P